MSGEVIVALVGAFPATVAAFAAWRAARFSKPVGNGFTEHVLEELGQIKGLLKAHVEDDRAHRR